MPWWLAWVLFIPFLGPAVSGESHDGEGGGSDGFGFDSGADGGGGGDGE
jgi:hypothetical protein